MYKRQVSLSKELGSKWIDHSVESHPLGKTNIFSQSSRSNEAPQQSNYRGAGLAEMINAIENQKLHLCNGELALHVLDIIESTMLSAVKKQEIEMRSNCQKPKPFIEKEILSLMKY